MIKKSWLIGAGLVVALLSGSAFAQGSGDGNWMWGYGPVGGVA